MNNKFFRKAAVMLIGFLMVVCNLSTDALYAEEKAMKTLTATLDTMEVELSYEEGSIPEGAQLQVLASTKETNNKMKSEATKMVDGIILAAKGYDVSVKDTEGNAITLTSSVTLTFKNLGRDAITNAFMQHEEFTIDAAAEIVDNNVIITTKTLSNFLFVNVEKARVSEADISNVTEPVQAANTTLSSKDDKDDKDEGFVVDGNPLSFKFGAKTNHEGKYYLQIRVYDKNDQLLQTLKSNTESYRFDDDDLKIMLSSEENYIIDGVYFDQIKDAYNKESVRSKKIELTNNEVNLDLEKREKQHESLTNYLDIYVSEVGPKVEGSLSITSKLDKGDLSDDDYAFELKKSYDYQVIDQSTGDVLKGQFKYKLYDLKENRIGSTLVTKDDGIFQIRADRKADIDLSSLGAKETQKYVIKQTNGDRYETTNSINGNDKKAGKETAEVMLVNNKTDVVFINKRLPVSEIVTYDKTASISNWDNRTYNVNLQAGYKSNEVIKKENADVFFVLDVSGSMIYTDAKIEGSGNNDVVTKKDLNSNYIYFTKPFEEATSHGNYGYGVKITNKQVQNLLANAKNNEKYKGIQTVEGNKIIFFDGSSWKYLEIDKGVEIKGKNDKVTYEYSVKKDGDGNEIISELTDEDLKQGVYTQRSSILISSVNEFIDGMSDDCSVGIATFGSKGKQAIDLTQLNSDENRKKITEVVNQCYGVYNQGTNMSTGLNFVKNNHAFALTKNQKYIIAFTDGEDNAPNVAKDMADDLKQSSTIFTIGVGKTNEAFLKEVATTPDNFLSSSSMSDIYDLLEIISDQIGNAYFKGTMIDYIDSRFDIVDHNGNKLEIGDKIVDSNNSKIIGEVGQDENGLYVKWVNQVVKSNTDLAAYTWNATINLKAKEDFLGGNVILTNQAGSTLTTSLSNQDKDIMNFPMPSVNVKELSFSIDNDEQEIEIGDEITPVEYIKILNKSISMPSLKLNDEEIQQLFGNENKILTKDYSYSNDKVGKLVYKLESTNDGVDDIRWSNHNATHSSNSKDGKKVPVETYKLTVTYEPISVDKRNETDADTMSAIDKVCSTITVTGTYDVYVKGGAEIVLNKTAKSISNNDRSFEIELSASSHDIVTETITTPMDVILVLDNSGTMREEIGVLNSSVKKFIRELSEESPNSRIGIISFNRSANDITKGFKNVNEINYGNLSVIGETNMGSAMKIVYDNYFNAQYFSDSANKERNQTIITLTDGRNNCGGAYSLPIENRVVVPNEVDALTTDEINYLKITNPGVFAWENDEPAVRFAKYFKKTGVQIYSVGLGDPNDAETPLSTNFLKLIASKPTESYYSNPRTTADLSYIFEALSQTITTKRPVWGATITDTITKEFKITEDEKARLRADGAEVVENDNGTTTVTWKNQTILYAEKSEDGWNKTINVVAKDDFLGGNYAPTNTEATLAYGKYEYVFPKPTVNVGLLNITLGNEDHLVFKGTQISPIECINELNASINIASLKLSEAEIAELVKDGTLTRSEYIYKNDSNFGKIVYTLTKTGVENSEDHIAKTESSVDNAGRLPVETYELKVEYVALTVEEREAYLKGQNIDLEPYTDPTNGIKTSSYGSGIHKIYVASGELDITKTINKQYTTEDKVNANQSFVFKITKMDLEKNVVDTFYQTISFSANENKTTKTVKIKGLDAGYYTVEEVQDWSWKYKLNKESDNYSNNNVENKEIYIGDTVENKLFGVEEGFNIAEEDYSSPAKSTFNNEKITSGPISQIISDVASAINKFNN